MVEINIFRPQTDYEKRDFINVNRAPTSLEDNKTILQIRTLETDYLGKKHIPFCRKCALDDYKDNVLQLKKEITRSGQPLEAVKDKIEALKTDLNKYADPTRFTMFGEKESPVMRLIDGIKTLDLDGYVFAYKCKVRGCKMFIKVPIKECEKYRKDVLPKYLSNQEEVKEVKKKGLNTEEVGQ